MTKAPQPPPTDSSMVAKPSAPPPKVRGGYQGEKPGYGNGESPASNPPQGGSAVAPPNGKHYIEVFSPGQAVIVGEDIEAKVTQVCLKEGGHISYQVIWWSGREHKSEWLEAFEVTGGDSESTSIGFTRP